MMQTRRSHPARTTPRSGGDPFAVTLPTDHLAHPQAEIEWWYVFGFLAERYTLMSCFWRYRGRESRDEGHMAVYALTEIDGPRRRRGTYLDEPMLRLSREKMRDRVSRQRDVFLETVLEMTDGGQVFAPYRLARSASCLSSPERPVAFTVGPCRLTHDGGPQRLRLDIDDGDLGLALDIDASTEWFPMCGRGAFTADGLRFWGYTHPQAPTAGRIMIDGRSQEITGRSWHDHEWGDWTFLNVREEARDPEWRYVSVLLDDGRSLNVYHWLRPGKGAQEREAFFPSGARAVLSGPDGAIRTLGQVEIMPRDSIESLRTSNLYEYGWTLQFPEIEGSLELTPFHPDQEVFVFTRQRGVLEAAGRVTGSILGRPCQGLGFVETFGESVDVNDFFWGHRKANLSRELERFMPRRFDPAWLQRVCGVDEPLAVDPDAVERAIIDPIWSVIDRRSKGWRSSWAITCCHALGYDRSDRQIRELLPVIEMLHTGSLVIDDIEDGSRLRRGQPALHRQIGTDLAINVGNFLYFLPLLIIQEAGWPTEQQRTALYNTVANALRQGHLGQAMDLMWAKQRYDLRAKVRSFERTREELLEQYRLKSGCQLEAVARIAGIVSGAPEPLVAAVADYSRVFGVVFQIVDDLIDLQESREKLGKEEGEDLRNGKLNLVLLHALGAATDRDRETLIEAMLHASRDDRLQISREIIRQTGAVHRCITDAEAMIEDAWPRLADLPPTDAKVVMRSVPKWLLFQRTLKQQELEGQAAASGAGSPPSASSRPATRRQESTARVP